MRRQRRNRSVEQAAISAAADRLLTGTPLRSPDKLTVSALITECELRRDVVYEHSALVEAFKARVRAQRSTPLAMQELADEHVKATRQIIALKTELTTERTINTTLRKMIAELSLELQQAHDQLTTVPNVVPLHTGAVTSPRSSDPG